ncbi:MAG: hypothetical protein IPK85_22315 [Gemmatimonadetes bacterium]|nr:hypothetical protein [Gemmatimonadota bacterium]
MKSSCLGALALALMATPGRAQMGIPEFDDPCRAEVELYLSIPAYSDGLWGSTQLLSDFAWKIRGDMLRFMNDEAKRIQEKLPAASPAEQAEMMGQLRAYRDCLPWLLALLGRVEARLKELGANILIKAGPTREQMTRDALFKEAGENIATIRATLDRILAQRRGLGA